MTLKAYYESIYGKALAQILLAPELDALDRACIKMQPDKRQLRVGKEILSRAQSRAQPLAADSAFPLG